MKKIVISLSLIIIAIVTVIIMIIMLNNRMTDLKIGGFLDKSELNLGKYKVEKFESGKLYKENSYMSFIVDSPNDFYNEVIKKSNCYNSQLEVETNEYYAYGYLCENESLYSYSIEKNGKVVITSVFGSYYDEENDEYYYIPGPFHLEMNKDRILGENEKEFKYYSTLSEKYINDNFGIFLCIITYMPKTYFNVTKEGVFVKGIQNRYDETANTISLKESNDYILKIDYNEKMPRIIII